MIQPNPTTPIKTTTSLCPVCLDQLPATVFERDRKVYLAKTCQTHGHFEVLINSDRRWYFESHGANSNAGAGDDCCGGGNCCGASPTLTVGNTSIKNSGDGGGGHDPTLVEQSSTCIALIELVASCNLKCPTCYADSPFAPPDEIDALSCEEFRERLGAVLQRKGAIDILQLSGGEPTIHPQFLGLLEETLRRDDVGYVLINTNGLRIARDRAFADRLGQLRKTLGKFEVYLQFDGTQAAGQRELRGVDLRKLRDTAVQRCADRGIPVTLAMTVNAHNLPHLGDTLRYALQRPPVRGLCFQPEFGSGRSPTGLIQLGSPATAPVPLNVADIITQLIDQSENILTDRDFTPLPCGDPNCHAIGYLLRRGDRVVRVSEFIDFAELQGFLKNRVDFNIEDLARCGCENQELGRVLHELEIGPDDVLRIFVKPFMDAWTYDQHRIDRCCVHVIGEGGKLESFCRHYAMR